MQNEFWFSMASKDLVKAREFFVNIGFEINDRHSGKDMVSLFLGNKKTVLCLFPESTLQGFIHHTVTNTAQSNEAIFSIGANSTSEVDEMAQKAEQAGGYLFAKPGYKDGWMYGCGFADLDGHRWNVLYMDMEKMPRK